MPKLETIFNVLILYILAGVLMGAFSIQYLFHEKPCPLCLLQRVAMLSVAAGAILNLKFGSRLSHYGLILLSCLVGGMIALRHIALHVIPDTPPFGEPVLGLSLYTWSFFIFCSTILWVATITFIQTGNKAPPPTNNFWIESSTILILGITVVNALSTLVQCGLGTC